MREAEDSGLWMSLCSGIEKIHGSPRCRTPNEDEIQSPVLPWTDRFLNWDNIRFIGKLPIFGASTTILIMQPAILYVLSTYNDYVQTVRTAIISGRVSSLYLWLPRPHSTLHLPTMA